MRKPHSKTPTAKATSEPSEEAKLDEALEESFPASDPPAVTPLGHGDADKTRAKKKPDAKR